MRAFNRVVGEFVELPDHPQRIVSLAPSITDTLFRLGLQDRIVGLSAFCHRPPETKKFPKVGSYLYVNYKRLDNLSPDLIITTGGVETKIAKELYQKGYPVFSLPLPPDPWEILSGVHLLGVILKVQDRARNLIFEIEKKFTSLKDMFDIRTYVEIDLGESITVGGPSYISAGLNWMGLKNIFSDDDRAYFTPEDEKIIKGKPDLILYDPKPHKVPSLEDVKEKLKKRGILRDDTALIVTAGDWLAHYGPSFLDTILPDIAEKVGKLNL